MGEDVEVRPLVISRPTGRRPRSLDRFADGNSGRGARAITTRDRISGDSRLILVASCWSLIWTAQDRYCRQTGVRSCDSRKLLGL